MKIPALMLDGCNPVNIMKIMSNGQKSKSFRMLFLIKPSIIKIIEAINPIWNPLIARICEVPVYEKLFFTSVGI
jgi:hypothetical protein